MNPDNTRRLKRFTPTQRLFHLLLMISFLVQAATGLGRMYHETSWGQGLAGFFGGNATALTVHVYVGLFMVFAFLGHLLYVLLRVDWRRFPGSLTGPDSVIPAGKDAKNFIQHLGWFFGLKTHPPLDRWGYWEKFDYWAVFWGMVILGGTGLLLAYPLFSSRFMPGWGLNVAFWVHRIEAILAMAHVFIIHFFVAHLRRSNFPMDLAMFEGSVDLKSARHERPRWIARLEESGRFEGLLVDQPPIYRKVCFLVFGYAAMAVGLFLLIGGLLYSTSITW